jgi:hypothetical protein
MKPTVGSFVFATNQGLGVLAKSFYDAGVVDDLLVIAHGKRKENEHWYPNSRKIYSLSTSRHELYSFCKSVDVMLFFETPFDWSVIDYCKQVGTKTILMPMYECMPAHWPARPDMILCPSLLDKQYYPDRSTHIPVPFEGEWKRRGKITTFVHNSGNGGLRGRNGTKEFVAALTYLDSDCDVIIRTQSDYPTHKDIPLTKATVEIRSGDADHSSLYSEGEAFVFPEKFNGLSLPLQEAYASGMVVLATNRFPNYTWLPSKHLIPTRGFCETRIAPHLQRFSEAIVNPIDIAVKMDEAFGTDAGDYSEMARSRVEDEFSWKVLKSRYMELIRNVSEM